MASDKYHTIDQILNSYQILAKQDGSRWDDERFAAYLSEFPGVGEVETPREDQYGNFHEYEYNHEAGLRKASLEQLQAIEKDIRVNEISSKLPKNWDEIDKEFGDTTFIRVFISHINEAKEVAKALKEFLEKHEMRCFVAHEDIKATTESNLEMKKALRTMECFIAINLNSNANKEKPKKTFMDSVWCLQESGAAIVREIPIVHMCYKSDKEQILKRGTGFLQDLQMLSLNKEANEKNRNLILKAVQEDKTIKNKLLDIKNFNDRKKTSFNHWG